MSGTSSNATKERSERKQKGGQNAPWKGFVDIPLSEKDKEHIKAMSTFAEDVLGNISALVEQGNKLSLSMEDNQGTWVTAVTGKVQDDPNCGYTLTARGGSLERAINALAYKVFELAQGGVWDNAAQIASKDDVA